MIFFTPPIMIRTLRLVFFLSLILTLSGLSCKTDNLNSKSSSDKLASPRDDFYRKLTIDSLTIWVEIADNDAERQKGLMWREELKEDHGMLFVFPSPQIQSFWMRNTYLPLDIAFIDEEWVITDILQMEPLIDTIYYKSSKPVPYALEMNQGWFEKRQVKVGDKINLE